MRATYLRTDFR